MRVFRKNALQRRKNALERRKNASCFGQPCSNRFLARIDEFTCTIIIIASTCVYPCVGACVHPHTHTDPHRLRQLLRLCKCNRQFVLWKSAAADNLATTRSEHGCPNHKAFLRRCKSFLRRCIAFLRRCTSFLRRRKKNLRNRSVNMVCNVV